MLLNTYILDMTETISTDKVKEITIDRAVTACGNSLIIKATKELDAMGVKKGDVIRVTFKKI